MDGVIPFHAARRFQGTYLTKYLNVYLKEAVCIAGLGLSRLPLP